MESESEIESVHAWTNKTARKSNDQCKAVGTWGICQRNTTKLNEYIMKKTTSKNHTSNVIRIYA